MRGDDELDKIAGESRRQNSTQSDQQFRRTSMSRDELLEQCTKQGLQEIVPGALLDPVSQGLRRDYDHKKTNAKRRDSRLHKYLASQKENE